LDGTKIRRAQIKISLVVSRSFRTLPIASVLSEVFVEKCETNNNFDGSGSGHPRPRQRELLIELYRKGKITEAFQSFKKIYLEVVHRIIDYLETRDSANMPH
jgi:hypothetical protein